MAIPTMASMLPRSLASVFLFHGYGKVANVAGFAEMMGLPLLVVTYFLIMGNAQSGNSG